MTTHSFPFPIRFSCGTLGSFFLFFLLTALSSASAAEYFVTPEGDAKNNGLSREAAFATIQQGVDALQPGDTLTVGPGEYFESVRREDLGAREVETIIRAEISGTVLLRGDVPAPEFEKVEEFRFVYAAPFEREPLAVLEHDTLRVLAAVPGLDETEFSPGSFYYDEAARKLYIAPSDLRNPAGRNYTVSLLDGSGLYLDRPVNVVIDGLAATGFCGAPRGHGHIPDRSWGVALNAPTDCVVRGTRVFMNSGGIGLENGSGNQVDDCVAFGNRTHNILVYGGANNRDNVIENSYAYRSSSGMHFYAQAAGPMILRDNVAWGHDLDFSNKTGRGTSEEFGVVERCVGLGDFQANGLVHTIMGGLNEFDRRLEAAEGNILFQREEALDLSREFADPINLDFRLRTGSRFRGREGGADRGPHPYGENIYYLSPEGSDKHDGLGVAQAWQTLVHALEHLQPGDTLYLEEGSYETGRAISLAGSREAPIRIRGRGHAVPVIRGGLELRHSAGIEFARLAFDGPVRLEGGKGLAFENCRFGGENGGLEAGGVEGLKVEHCFFAGHPLRLAQSSGTWLRGNLFANEDQPALLIEGGDPFLHTDYNGYLDARTAWRIDGNAVSLDHVRSLGHDLHSRERPVSWTLLEGVPTVREKVAVQGWGPDSGALGVHNHLAEPAVELAGPFVHSVEETAANLEWWASKARAFELRWGPTPAMEHRVEIPAAFQYSGYSLTGLEPGATYYAAVRTLGEEKEVIKESAPVEFQTSAAAREPAVYHVATGGDDSHDGLTSESAFRTVSRAASVAGAGDTVLVGGGRYPETVRIRGTGTGERPVRYRSAPGERAQVRTFRMSGKSHVRVDGFYTSGEMRLVLCNDIEITRCFATGPLLLARNCADVLVKNCVATRGYPFSAVTIQNSPRFRVENSVMLNPSISGALVKNEPGQTAAFRRNIFTDSIPFKAPVAYFAVGRAESLKLEENCFYMRAPDPKMGLEKRNMFEFYGDEAYDRTVPVYGVRPASEVPPSVYTELTRASLEDYHAHFGETGSVMTNPRFQGAAGLNLEEGARFTEDDNLSNPNNTGYLILSSDRMGPDLDFPDLFTTDPELIEKGIGLVPEDFKDFHFERIPRGDVSEKTRKNP